MSVLTLYGESINNYLYDEAYSEAFVSYISRFNPICTHKIHDIRAVNLCVNVEFCEGNEHTILFASVRLIQAHPYYSHKTIMLKDTCHTVKLVIFVRYNSV